MIKVINILTGETSEPGFVSAEQKRYWFNRELNQNGKPDRRFKGHFLGVSKSNIQSGNDAWHWNGSTVLLPANDTQGQTLRAEYTKAQEALEKATVALYRHYQTH
jgi:hypothetical protein